MAQERDGIDIHPSHLAWAVLSCFGFAVLAIIGHDYVQRSRGRLAKSR